MGLTWMIERKPILAERLIAFGQPLPDEPDFLLYRLLTGLTEAITAHVFTPGGPYHECACGKIPQFENVLFFGTEIKDRSVK